MSFRHFHGIDFSGARDAGRKIWVATGSVSAGSFRISSIDCACTLLDCARHPAICLPSLCRWIQAHDDCAFGCDFPFGLPLQVARDLFHPANWVGFASSFYQRYGPRDPASFREDCWNAAASREKRRITDSEASTPFSAYNRRLFRQTFHGIRDVLAPLVLNGKATAAPMQTRRSRAALILEVCPASTLKSKKLDRKLAGFKRKSARETRHALLSHFVDGGEVIVPPQLVETIVNDPGGDALDSVIAAIATYRACADSKGLSRPDKPEYAIEGYVYV